MINLFILSLMICVKSTPFTRIITWVSADFLSITRYVFVLTALTNFYLKDRQGYLSLEFGGMKMTIAEIHGKLSPYEHMEDLLTSDVFSTFRYLDPNKGLVPFLKKAIGFVDQKQPIFLGNIVEADYIFWPRTTHLNREPDVLILLTKKDCSTISICIEAKYTSGKSDLIREEETTEIESNVLGHLDGDQLAELYKELQEGHIHIDNQIMREKFTKSKDNRYLFYVTAHSAFPRKDMNETWNVLKKKQYGNQLYNEFYWVNWMSILDVIEEVNAKETWLYDRSQRFLLTDLKDLLCRKGLVPFHGFSQLQPNFPMPEFFFWEEEVQSLEQPFFSRIDVSAIKKKENPYFWEED